MPPTSRPRCIRLSFLLAPFVLSPSLLLSAPLEKLTVDRIDSEPSLSGTLPGRGCSGTPTASGSRSCAGPARPRS